MVGCFSTALLTASSLYGLPVARLGTEMMLERLTPYQNSNRIPATLVNALIPDLSSIVRSDDLPRRTPDNLDALILTVGYAMQPHQLASRRSEVEVFLVEHYETRAHYFKRRRLGALSLPGRLPARPRPKLTMTRRLRWRVRRIRALIGTCSVGPSRPRSGSDTSAASMR